MKKIIFVGIAVFLLAAGTLYFFSQKRELVVSESKEEVMRGECLRDNEVASYEIEKNPEGGGIAKIFVKDKNSGGEKFSFLIKISSPRHYHPVEIHRCGTYAMRTFGYDYKKRVPLKDYRREFWKYDYKKKGRPLIIDSAKWSYENILGDFRVSPDEKYVFLIKSYLGKDDYALVIKDLKTKEDAYELKLKEILEKHTDVMPGSIGLGIFTPDGRYFWGDIYDGARETAYYRIEMETWKTEILPLPKDIPAGVERAWSFLGYVAYADFPTFFGIDEVAKQEQEKFKKEGREKHLYLYNLRTKEKKLLASTPDPARRFNIKWLSDTELEYELPAGEKKIYEIDEK